MKSLDSRLVHAQLPRKGVRSVNPPVERASTLLFDTVRDLERSKTSRFDPDNLFYARLGSPTVYDFESAVSELEGSKYSFAVPSGLAACVLPAIAYSSPGDHILVTDTVYDPVRTCMAKYMTRWGVDVEYFDPRIGAGIERLIRDETVLVILKSPGSLTFELNDIPEISKVAREKNVRVACDNTYATGYFHRPLDLGADFSCQAATKYIMGHSDGILGVISCNEIDDYRKLKEAANWLGYSVAPDVAWSAHRGIRTLPTRLQRHHENGLKLAEFLQAQPQVSKVYHPGLETHPDHALWKRDFTGATGLFAVLLNTKDIETVEKFVDELELFGIGFSWGSFESLAVISKPAAARSATEWTEDGILLRIHAGLEDPEDLIEDLRLGLARNIV